MSTPALIMVAPNGARRTKADHPKLPMTIAETAREAAHCREAGADAIHAHLRDADGGHVLDADGYRELTTAIRREAGSDMVVQITTEAVGRYSPEQQRALVDDVHPAAASVALREILPEGEDERVAEAFYGRCLDREIAIQHILYDTGDVRRMADLVRRGVIPDARLSLLFVLGRYAAGQVSSPADLVAFLAALREHALEPAATMTCAFGQGETASLACALAFGGNVRVGFENSLARPDGTLPETNAESVGRMATIAKALGYERPSRTEALAMLGLAR